MKVKDEAYNDCILDGYTAVRAQDVEDISTFNFRVLGGITAGFKSFRVLAQIASAVPKRVKFSKIEYNGSDLVVIEGTAFSDQDILKLISNLNNKKLISQASLASMTLPQGQQQGSQTMKGFKVACVLEQV